MLTREQFNKMIECQATQDPGILKEVLLYMAQKIETQETQLWELENKKCKLSIISSRVCEKGSNGCNVKHRIED